MSFPSISNTGYSGLMAAKAGIATTGHNISNVNTEGYSRQRVVTETLEPQGGHAGKGMVGTGTRISRVERVNDEYIEKQIRNSQRDLSNFEEKEVVFKQVEDIFNELNGDGLNRLISRFFNEFRKLSNEPESPAIRQSVREASTMMVNDFHRLRQEVDEVRRHIDSRIEGYCREVNSLTREVADLNQKILELDAVHGPPNDLLDKRDLALKKLASYMDLSLHKDRKGNIDIDIKGAGPLITGNQAEQLSVEHTPADLDGKTDGAFDIKTTGTSSGKLTHALHGGKLGALVSARDQMISSIFDRLDELAFNLIGSVNAIHSQGVTPGGDSGINFFSQLEDKGRAAEFIELSEEVKGSSENIVTALDPNSPGDNRVALAIARLQDEKVMGESFATFDEWYNSMVSDVGVATSRNRFDLNQQKDVMTQLGKIRDQVSGVSIDEETTNLLQFQHVFDACAKVIQVADELMKTVLALKRD